MARPQNSNCDLGFVGFVMPNRALDRSHLAAISSVVLCVEYYNVNADQRGSFCMRIV